MKLHRIWRKGSFAWQTVLYMAFLAMGLFVAFDLLDLDGSRLGSRTQPGTAAAFFSDAEDTLFQDPSRLEPTSLALRWQILRTFDDVSKLPGKVRPTPRVRFDSVRRHPQFRTSIAPAHPAAEDPF